MHSPFPPVFYFIFLTSNILKAWYPEMHTNKICSTAFITRFYLKFPNKSFILSIII